MPPRSPRDLGSRILVAAHDAGGSNAVAPVLKELATRRMPLSIFADGPAYELLSTQALDVQRLELEEAGARVGLLFDSCRPRLLLVGNSCGPSLEDRFVVEARKRKVPSVGILDSWLLYDRKFSDGTDPWAFLPDTLIVMDAIAKNDMVGLGAPQERLLPLGQPQFDQLQIRAKAFGEAAKQTVRASLGVPGQETLVLFLSQDMERFYGGREAALDSLGYTEYMVLDLLKERLSRLAARHGRIFHLVIKLHPRDDVLKYRGYGLSVVRNADPYSLMLSSDLVVGMDSILLIEGGLMGCPTLSLQPSRKGPDTLVTNRLGFGQYCYETDEVERKIEALLFDQIAREAAVRAMQRFSIKLGATERITKWILSALDGKTT